MFRDLFESVKQSDVVGSRYELETIEQEKIDEFLSLNASTILLNTSKTEIQGSSRSRTRTSSQARIPEAPRINAIVEEPVEAANPNQCPKCNKVFKRLSMHKCK